MLDCEIQRSPVGTSLPAGNDRDATLCGQISGLVV
jgi:hypothetical protein